MFTDLTSSRQRYACKSLQAMFLAILLVVLPALTRAQPVVVTEQIRVAASSDDAEQTAEGYYSRTSSDLEMTFANGTQTIGIRFDGLQIPRGADVSNAYIQFQVDEATSGQASLQLRGQAADNAATFSTSSDVLSRPPTQAAVAWSPPSWPTVSAQTADQRTSNIASVIQEIVDRPGWDIGHALVILVTGTGERVAESYDGDANAAPMLVIEYSLSAQEAPLVDVGPDQSVTLPDSALLVASVSDDGLPNPPGSLELTWSQVSGPGTVSFSDPNASTTSASFSLAGDYIVELSVNDGEKVSSDSLSIIVNHAPGAPALTSFSPSSAQVATVVSIGGNNLSSAQTVTFGGTSARFSIVSDTLIYATVPPGALTGAISVTNPFGLGSSAASFGVIPSPAVLVGAGDIADCVGEAEATATLLDAIPGTVFTTGDQAYSSGSDGNYADCYDPTWGRHKSRTRPVPGGSDYITPGASGYYNYFGPAAGDPDKGWYSYDLGDWHVIALNSRCNEIGGCDVESPQGRWLREDLLLNPSVCTIAYWASPRFNSGDRHGSESASAPFWDLLYAAGAELIINGHEHIYERFAPQRPDGTADPFGVRAIIVGTGGRDLYTVTTVLPNSEVHETDTHGVLRLTLHPSSYDWQFVPIAGRSFTDQGSYVCHQVNQVPLIDAGPDIAIDWPATAELAGRALDDGLPSATFAPTWSKVSGPGTASFDDSTAAATSVSFSQPGVYELRLSGDDGEFFESDDVTVFALDPATEVSDIDVSVAASLDDVEENVSNGSISTGSSDLELIRDGSSEQIIGMRFPNIEIPQGASILNAYIQFQVDEATSESTVLNIRAEAIDSSPPFLATSGNVSSRTRTLEQVSWSPAPWLLVGESGEDQRTPDLSLVVQEVVDRGGWSSGNALAILIEGTGKRVAESYDGTPSGAPRLHVTYGVSSGGSLIDVPDVTGQTQTSAEVNLIAAGLSVGTVTTQSSETVGIGLVISQSPVGCLACANSGDPVSLVVSSGPALIDVPDVTGQTQTSAEVNLIAAGLTVGTVTTQSSETVAAGVVISQSPVSCLSCASTGDPVSLVVSSGSALIDVPNVTGQTQTSAEANLIAAGLTVGTVTTQSSETVAAGVVISQSPISCLACANAGDPVSLVVSSGSALIDVPNVTGQTQTSAEANLIAAGLSVGTVTTQSSETIAAGIVISQSPVGCLACASTGDPVSLIVSSGSTPPVVTISAPADGGIETEGVAITFIATASDAEDGNLSASIVWTSSKDGLLGTGATIAVTLSQGRHTVTASVTDSQGVSATAEVSLRVQNSRGPK